MAICVRTTINDNIQVDGSQDPSDCPEFLIMTSSELNELQNPSVDNLSADSPEVASLIGACLFLFALAWVIRQVVNMFDNNKR
jgi:hypothetical protein